MIYWRFNNIIIYTCLLAASKQTLQEINSTPLAHLLESLFRVLWSGKWAVLTPTAILGFVWNIAPSFRGYRQQDSHELLLLLEDGLTRDLDAIEDKLRHISPLPPAAHILRSALHGELQTEIVCQSCGYTSTSKQLFACIPVHFPPEDQSLSKLQKQNQSSKRAGKRFVLFFCLFLIPWYTIHIYIYIHIILNAFSLTLVDY